MATVYKADNFLVPTPVPYEAGVVAEREFLFTVATALALNDTIWLCEIPGEHVIVVSEWYLDIPDLDDATSIQLQLGDDDTADKFMAASTVGQAAGRKASANLDGVAASLPVSYTAMKHLILKVSTGPGTGSTGGVIRGWVRYHKASISTPV